MKHAFRSFPGWIGVLVLATGLLIWSDRIRIRRVEYVTSIAQESAPVPATSPTGYAGGTRELIVPEHLDACYEWIAETQRMFARHEWRVRSADNENAPFGRPVHHASPYRWWLGLVAWGDHLASHRPIGLAVEHAALLADPLLHLLLLIAVTAFVARHFGSLPAGVTALGLVTLFPFALGFLPAVPEDYVLTLGLVLASIFPLVIGLRSAPVGATPAAGDVIRGGRRARSWFFAAGIAGGLGVWLDVGVAVPLQLGIGAGTLLAAAMTRRPDGESGGGESNPPWRAWALGGAGTILLAYLAEYFPGHLGGWELRAVHPLYGVSWLGGGELLARAVARIRRARPARCRADAVLVVLAAAALAALPLVMWKTDNAGFLALDLLSFRLTKQVDGVFAPSLLQWLTRDGVTATAGATLLVLAPWFASLGLFLRRGVDQRDRAALAVGSVPALAALALALIRLRWWQVFDALALVQAGLATAILWRTRAPILMRGAWLGLLALAFGAGLGQLELAPRGTTRDVLSLPEVEGLIERDLAHWLAKHSTHPDATLVLAPPDLTATLDFYGGMRGLGTLSWENKDGLSVALRIVISTSPREAQALAAHRGVTYIVIPSWNRFFEDYSRPAEVQVGEMFYAGLQRGNIPPWLRPVPFQLPHIAGFDGQSVLILEVVDEQDEPGAQSHLAEYFVEMGRFDQARNVSQALRRFPTNLGALVARAQVDYALRDAVAFPEDLAAIERRITAGADRFMPWDRRLSLAVVLARGHRMDLAREQMTRCLAGVTAARLRSLTAYALFHFELLRQDFGLEVPQAELRALIRDLLPPAGMGDGT